MRIATWNVNSIRTRLEQVLTWLRQQAEQDQAIDVLCLQEIKVIDTDFPAAQFEAEGYCVALSGQKTYNGVAFISQNPMSRVMRGFTPVLAADTVGDLDDQKRLIAGSYQGVHIINVYVPNGSEVNSDKYDYKLRWLSTLKQYLATQLQVYDQLLICGDFNIAPTDQDIYSDRKVGQIMASSPERAILADIMALGLIDIFRQFTPDPGYFSWWDYRGGSFPRNRGWRIDFHLVNDAVRQQAQGCVIDVEPRSWLKPSDHTPVILEL